MPAEISGPVFTLDIGTDSDANVVRLRLTDEQGRQLGANQVRLAEHSPARWQGLFDTRAFVQTYANSVIFTDRPATAAELLEQIGVFLGEKVLGPEILAALLHHGIRQRSLLVRQPEALEDRLAMAVARVPWEIARPAAGQAPLLERNLVVRMETPVAVPAWAPPPPGADEPLRVLLVFAEAPGSRPLAMRLEREQLLELFYDEVMPKRQVSVDVLCHGVTREALREKVRDADGYHVVHWSGHGHHNLLELLGADGQPDHLTGTDLVDLFAEAGGFIPQLVFLSACLSGTLVDVHDWGSLESALREGVAGTRKAGPAPEKVEQLIAEQPGYTGTALALLGAGVPQVVAMRYEVGDAYARDLASLFYRRLLADTNLKSPASALSNARGELLKRQTGGYHPVDHATPLLFGGEVGPLPVPRGPSAARASRWPQPQPLLTGSRELDRPAELVGRGEPLSQLRRCLEEERPAVAIVQGLAGLGKTALVAEAIHLWHRRFAGVFALQSKPQALRLDDVLRRLDEQLALHIRVYRESCEQNPNARVWLPPGQPLSGEARWQKMRDNLLGAMRSERLLLVLDNFETHLEKMAGPDGYACADPEWDRLLRHLAENLPGSGSRLLVTSRHRLAVLAEKALWLPLGPLPMAEAILFLQGNEALHRLAYGDETGRKLALRLLEVSRGHPLILTKLGALAGDREALEQALAELDTQGLDRLPDVFALHFSKADRERERKYLEDAAVGAVDLLIQRASPDARRFLWMVTLAGEPVSEILLQDVWNKEGATVAPAAPLLAELTGAGLLMVEEGGAYGSHELVRERIAAWMGSHSDEKGGCTDEQIWLAYGECYAAAFEVALSVSGEVGSREKAVEAGRRGISYLVRARDFDRLGFFADVVVISTRDQRLLHQVIAELEGVAEQVPTGTARWFLRTYLADALSRICRPDEALPLYELAVTEAEEAGHWSDVGSICHNWAVSLKNTGQLSAAHGTFLRSAEANSRAGSPPVHVVCTELEALRVAVMQGRAEQALPEIENRLRKIQQWWRRHLAGEPVPETPDFISLKEALLIGLDCAREANQALARSEACLRLLSENEEIRKAWGAGEHELAMTRFDCYPSLLLLDRVEEAKWVLENCIAVFRRVGDSQMEAKASSALAALWDRLGDIMQAIGLEKQALALLNRLPDSTARAISHGNLANYLGSIGARDAARHRLVAIAYDLSMEHKQSLLRDIHNLAIDIRNAEPRRHYELPRLANLLACSEFEPLQRTLSEWNVALDGLQARIDELVEEVRRGVERPPEEGAGA